MLHLDERLVLALFLCVCLCAPWQAPAQSVRVLPGRSNAAIDRFWSG